MSRKKHPRNNCLYYAVGCRVLWRNHPGTVFAYAVKPYPAQVGYHINLDDPSRSGNRDVLNAGYTELRLESTGLPSTDGFIVSVPSEPTRYL